MSKAFTKEEDGDGFAKPSSSALAIPPGPFRITQKGALLAAAHEDPRVREALARAEILPAVIAPERAALGVTVRVRVHARDHQRTIERAYRLVSAEEAALLKSNPSDLIASVDGPIGRSLLGASIGDVREVVLPRGVEELEVIALEG